ncbi:hypothetical protein SAY87_025080 [Trapa incisa]|uniref:Piriformospora indica-insensitive protein 2 n=1 Tax=Trapa incisa TaxID=236973 RepID=A0AAN7GS29_9MYRT|nr:hypothetical protein SAY87_025080 [Trapa incisa]
MGRCVLLIFTFMVLSVGLERGRTSDGGGAGTTGEAPMDRAEKEALYSAIRGFVGDWWNGSYLYPDPCGFTPIQGVSCDLFGGQWYVTSLNIGPVHENSLNCSAKPLFSSQLFDLKHLKSLSFFNCFVYDHQTLPPDSYWDGLSGSLESLEIRTNPGLTGGIPSSFGRLLGLWSLVIIENGLNGTVPTNLGDLAGLKRLVLAGNRFTGPIPNSFGGLTKLLILDMSSNSLSGPLPPSIGSMASLLKLDLSNNMLHGDLPSDLGNLRSLTLLDLRNNSFSGGLIPSLHMMESLEELALSRNPIGGDIGVLDWQKFKGLAVLDLSGMGLTGEIPEAFSQLEKIRFLGLSDNILSGALPPKLETLPCLSALYVNGNNLSGEIKFSTGFYDRMGWRFGAWDNPNLCYPAADLGPNGSRMPHRVRPCGHEEEKEVVRDPSISGGKGLGADGGDSGGNSHFLPILGFSNNGADGFQCSNFWVHVLLLAVVSSFLE